MNGNKERVVKAIGLQLCLAMIVLFSGCFGHTIVTKKHYFPSHKNYDTADFTMQIEVHGEKRKAYTASTQKKVIVSIWEGQEKLFNREYVCRAASLEWDVVWEKLNDLLIVFFDFPEGISIYDENALELTARHVFSLRFMYDSQTKEFGGYPVSQAVVRHAKTGK